MAENAISERLSFLRGHAPRPPPPSPPRYIGGAFGHTSSAPPTFMNFLRP